MYVMLVVGFVQKFMHKSKYTQIIVFGCLFSKDNCLKRSWYIICLACTHACSREKLNEGKKMEKKLCVLILYNC